MGRVARDISGHLAPLSHHGQGCHPLYQVASFVIPCWLAKVLPPLCAAFLWLSLKNAWFAPSGTQGAQLSNSGGCGCHRGEPISSVGNSNLRHLESGAKSHRDSASSSVKETRCLIGHCKLFNNWFDTHRIKIFHASKYSVLSRAQFSPELVLWYLWFQWGFWSLWRVF